MEAQKGVRKKGSVPLDKHITLSDPVETTRPRLFPYRVFRTPVTGQSGPGEYTYVRVSVGLRFLGS